ncbi:PRAME family member 3-like [Microtus pennsylvanicus]|uniref:PRAME family member 3-like n=1 Tax=Microtus pennsylvanicus TaxID=10058 RepID=UPI003F6AF892
MTCSDPTTLTQLARCPRIVKAMVETWPFPCLPVGTLMKTPNEEILQTVPDGIDMQLARRLHPRKEKHQVLDLRHVCHDFWRIQTRTEEGNCSAETVDGEQVVKVLPRQALRRLLKVIADLCLRPHLEEEQACFLQWAQQRKGFLQLCYMKMKICALPVCSIKKTLNVFQAWHIEELELNWRSHRVVIQFTLKSLNVDSLQKLHLDNVYFLKGHMDQLL